MPALKAVRLTLWQNSGLLNDAIIRVEKAFE